MASFSVGAKKEHDNFAIETTLRVEGITYFLKLQGLNLFGAKSCLQSYFSE
jgi:hypothetical protein